MDPYAPRHHEAPRHTPAARALTKVILEVFRLYGLCQQEGKRLSAPVRQTTARWRVLGAVVRADGQETVSQLARRMGLTRQAVQRLARALARDGLVELCANPAHRRAPLVRITRKGDAALRALAAKQVAWSNARAGDFDPAELERVAEVLRRVAERVERGDA